MKSINTSRLILILLITSLALGGCATSPKDSELEMPGWFEGYDDEDKEEADKPQTEDFEAESSADASDRISQEPADDIPEEAAITSEDEFVEGPTSQVDAGPQDADTVEEAPDEAAAEPEVPPPPKPAPLAPQSEQHALEAQQAQPRYQAALKKLKSGDLEGALVLFQELSVQFPTLAGPLVNQSIILRKQNKLEQAKAILQKGLLNKLQNPYMMNEMGLVYRRLGKFEAAKQAYLSAIRMEPNYDKAHYNLAVVADLYLHDPALAFEEFKIYQSLQKEPDKKVAGWLIEIERRIP